MEVLPLGLQIYIAAQFALRACAHLVGLELPTFGEPSTTFIALWVRSQRTQPFLADLRSAQMPVAPNA